MIVADIGAPPAGTRPRLASQLYLQVLVAIALGAALGHFLPAYGEAMKPLGDGFIKLVKMIIAPVIFLTLVTGIAGMKELGSGPIKLLAGMLIG